MFPARREVLAAMLCTWLALEACAKSPTDAPPPASSPEPAPASGPGASASGPAGSGSGAPAASGADALRRARAEAQPLFDPAARLADASAPDPACATADLDVAAAVVDPRCAIGAREAKLLRAALEKRAPATLRQEASLDEDRRVLVRLVNTGDEALALPLSYHPELPAFSAFAEAPDRAIYELEAPKLDVPGPRAREGDAGVRARFARIVIAPKRAAIARVRVAPVVLRRVAPACPDGGACAPPCRGAGPCAPTLAPGAYVLHVGELVVDVEAGAPARVAWTVP